MRNRVPRISSFGRAFDLLDAIIADGGRSSISAIARRLETPVATAHRQVATLADAGLLKRLDSAHYIAGGRLVRLLRGLDEKQIIATVAAPFLHALAGRVGNVVQLGTFENDMVTYRIKTGEGANDLFTKVGMQIEAYCSGIGKVLLAHLPEGERDAYLASGPFVALTERTIVDPEVLAKELSRVANQGYAMDNGEIEVGLVCLAVPIQAADDSILAAISVSRFESSGENQYPDGILTTLRHTAREIEEALKGFPF